MANTEWQLQSPQYKEDNGLTFKKIAYAVQVLAGIIPYPSGVTPSPPPAPARAGYSSTPTGNGTVAAGAYSFQAIFSPDFAGTIDVGAGAAMTFAGGVDYSYAIDGAGGTLPVITYTISAGSMRISGV